MINDRVSDLTLVAKPLWIWPIPPFPPAKGRKLSSTCRTEDNTARGRSLTRSPERLTSRLCAKVDTSKRVKACSIMSAGDYFYPAGMALFFFIIRLLSSLFSVSCAGNMPRRLGTAVASRATDGEKAPPFIIRFVLLNVRSHLSWRKAWDNHASRFFRSRSPVRSEERCSGGPLDGKILDHHRGANKTRPKPEAFQPRREQLLLFFETRKLYLGRKRMFACSFSHSCFNMALGHSGRRSSPGHISRDTLWNQRKNRFRVKKKRMHVRTLTGKRRRRRKKRSWYHPICPLRSKSTSSPILHSIPHQKPGIIISLPLPSGAFRLRAVADQHALAPSLRSSGSSSSGNITRSIHPTTRKNAPRMMQNAVP